MYLEQMQEAPKGRAANITCWRGDIMKDLMNKENIYNS
jgi:hypothetical protein